MSWRLLGNIKGEDGARGADGQDGVRGPAGTFESASAVSVSADSPAKATLSGPDTAKSIRFDIPRGLPGVNALENDAAVSVYVAATDSATRTKLNAVIATTGTAKLDIRKFLNAFEVWPEGGTLNASTLIQRVIDYAREQQKITPEIHYIPWIPEGRYRINSSLDLVNGSPTGVEGITVEGEGEHRTILLPYGSASGFTSSGTGVTVDTPKNFFWHRNVHIKNLTIDMSNQTYPEPSGLQKAIQGGLWKDCTIENVTGIGSTATMFGTDYPVNMKYINVTSINAGRGTVINSIEPRFFAEHRSGFGIGFGLNDDESITFTDCTATGAARSGFFFERQDQRGTTARTATIRLVNCTAVGNGNGITDAGCNGVLVVGGKITDNKAAGFYTGVNTNAVIGGRNGRITGGTYIARNAFGFFASGTVDATPLTDYATVIGGYTIENSRIEKNTEGGIVVEKFEAELGGFKVTDNTIASNGGLGGLRMRDAKRPVRDVVITGNLFDGNTGIGCAPMIPMIGPRIADNTYVNAAGGGTMSTGLLLHPAEPVVAGRVYGNTYRSITGPERNLARLTLVTPQASSIITGTDDSDNPPGLLDYSPLIVSSGTTTSATLGTGWIQGASVALDWTRTNQGAQVTGGTTNQRAFQYRDLGRNDLYVEAGLPPATAGATYLRGVVIGYNGAKLGIVAGVGDIGGSFGSQPYYCMWKITSIGGVDTVTLLFTSTVPSSERHKVALGRKLGSTVTTMFIDGIAQTGGTIDVPDVPVTNYAGLVSAASGTTFRRLYHSRILAYGAA